MIKIIIGIVIVVIIALVVGFIPIMEVPYTVTAQYQDTETYYVDEPYVAMETYTETELEPQVEILEHHADREGNIFWVRGKVKNISDVVLATIDISIHVKCPVKGVENSFREKSVVIDKPIAIQPGEVRDFELNYHSDDVTGDYTFKIHRPYTEITVVKERTVTKYRQVEKQRTVTKQHPEIRYKKATLFEYLIGY